jgi:hypothetical protein
MDDMPNELVDHILSYTISRLESNITFIAVRLVCRRFCNYTNHPKLDMYKLLIEGKINLLPPMFGTTSVNIWRILDGSWEVIEHVVKMNKYNHHLFFQNCVDAAFIVAVKNNKCEILRGIVHNYNVSMSMLCEYSKLVKPESEASCIILVDMQRDQ